MALFNTLTYARKLEAAGVPAEQAEIQSNTLAEIIEGVMVTKLDLENVERKVLSQMATLEKSMHSDVILLDKRFQTLETKVDGMESRLLIKLGSISVAVGGLVVAAIAIIVK